MVGSIRHWCLATQVLQEDTPVPDKGMVLQATAIGNALLSEGGLDPYLEDPASLWLLHWLLVSNREKATTWHLVFTVFKEPDFTKQRMLDFIRDQAERAAARFMDSSLSRDIDCFVRTYTPSRVTATLVLEDTMDCPLVELELIRILSDGQTYRFAIGPKPSLPAAIFGFAFLEYFNSRQGTRQTMAVEDCLYAEGSPGQAFKLDENSVIDYFEELQNLTHGAIGLDETAGLKQIYRRSDISPESLLQMHYR